VRLVSIMENNLLVAKLHRGLFTVNPAAFTRISRGPVVRSPLRRSSIDWRSRCRSPGEWFLRPNDSTCAHISSMQMCAAACGNHVCSLFGETGRDGLSNAGGAADDDGDAIR